MLILPRLLFPSLMPSWGTHSLKLCSKISIATAYVPQDSILCSFEGMRSLFSSLSLSDDVSMPPRSTLCVTSLGRSVDIQGVMGAPNASFQEHAPDAAAVASGWKLQSVEESDSTVTVDVTEVKTDHPHQQQSVFGRLTAFIPDKWINVKLYSPEGAGSFKVGRVNEADFEACTGGGSLEVGSIKGGKAVINTEGGSLKGRELSASEVRVETREGAVELQRFVALHGAIKSASAVNVTVVYGETVNVESGGSTISIGNLDCSTSASLLSRGGHITVNGLDGRAHIDSAGGNIKVYLSSGVGDVHVRSQGGDIDLVVNPDAKLHIHVSDVDGVRDLLTAGAAEASGGAAADAARITTGGEQHSSSSSNATAVTAFHDERLSPQSRTTRTMGSSTSDSNACALGQVSVDAGPNGRVRIQTMGWADALRLRLMAKKEEDKSGVTS